MTQQYFNNKEIDNLYKAILEEEKKLEKIENIADILNLTEEDRKCLRSYQLHFCDSKHPFDENALNTSDFKEEIKISGTQRLFYDLKYRQRIADIYENYLK